MFDVNFLYYPVHWISLAGPLNIKKMSSSIFGHHFWYKTFGFHLISLLTVQKCCEFTTQWFGALVCYQSTHASLIGFSGLVFGYQVPSLSVCWSVKGHNLWLLILEGLWFGFDSGFISGSIDGVEKIVWRVMLIDHGRSGHWDYG